MRAGRTQVLDALGHRHDPQLGLFAVRAALAENPKGFLLPKNMLRRETAEFGDPKTRIE